MNKKATFDKKEKNQRHKIEALVKQFIPTSSSDDYVARLVAYCSNILNCTLTSAPLDSNIKMTIVKRVGLLHEDKPHSEKEQIFNKIKNGLVNLSGKKIFKKKSSLLKLLHALSEFGDLKRITNVNQQESRVNMLLDANPSDYFPTSLFMQNEHEDPYSSIILKEDTEALLFDILKLLKEGSSNYLKEPSSNIESFTLKTRIQLPPCLLSACLSLANISPLLTILRDFYSTYPPISSTGRAFLSCLASFLSNFDAFLDTLLSTPCSSQRVTPINLISILQPMQHELVLLSWICDSLRGIQDCHILSVISVLGGSQLRAILEETSAPLREFLLKWTNEGEVSDPEQEFFISDRLELIWSRVPKFMSTTLVEGIFEIGRTVRLKQELQLQQLELERFVEIEIGKVSMEEVETWVNIVREVNHNNLVAEYKKESNFLHVIRFLKRTFLMQNGDFADAMINSLDPILMKPAEEVFFHDVIPVFRNLSEICNFSRLFPEISNDFGVRLLEKTHGDTGWDIFAYEMSFDQRVSYVLTPKLMLKLSQLCHFLLRIRRVYYRLNDIWLIQKQFLKRNDVVVSAYRMIFKCNMIRTHMAEFLRNLNYYVFYEVIESEFQEFEKQCEEASSIPQLKDHVEQLFSKLLSRCFVDSSGSFKLFEKINELLKHCEGLWSEFMRINNLLYIDGRANNNFPIRTSILSVDSLWNRYEENYYQFLTILKEDPQMRNSSFKFDFNFFHLNSFEKKATKRYFEKIREMREEEDNKRNNNNHIK